MDINKIKINNSISIYKINKNLKYSNEKSKPSNIEKKDNDLDEVSSLLESFKYWPEIQSNKDLFPSNGLRELFNEAYQMWRDSQYETAFQRFAFLANQGFSEAFGYLGLSYELGEGIEMDKNKMLICYKIAIREKQYLGVYRLGMYYTSSGQHEIAFKLYSLSIDEGWATADAYLKLGRMYENGIGVPINLSKAIEMYRTSYNKNKHEFEAKRALERLGVLYTLSDFQTEIPSDVAMLPAGRIYALAENLKYDNEALAYCYYAAAAKKNHAVAAINVLQIARQYEVPIEKDFLMLLNSLIDSMEEFILHNPSLASEAGYFFQYSKKDIEKAKKFYSIGAENDCLHCMRWLGDIASNNKDYKAAYDYYLRSAQLGQGMSMFALANLYKLGLGTEKNIQEAIYWYQKCADSNYAAADDAKVALRELSKTIRIDMA